jgi:hypothetical protein
MARQLLPSLLSMCSTAACFRLPENVSWLVDRLRLAPRLAVVGESDETGQLAAFQCRVVEEEPLVGGKELRVAVVGKHVEPQGFCPRPDIGAAQRDQVAVTRVVGLGLSERQPVGVFPADERRESVMFAVGHNRADFNWLDELLPPTGTD